MKELKVLFVMFVAYLLIVGITFALNQKEAQEPHNPMYPQGIGIDISNVDTLRLYMDGVLIQTYTPVKREDPVHARNQSF
jgi:hypothetical protein